MSDTINHYCCAKESFKKLPEHSAIKKIIDKHKDLFYLGAQGADFFFYYFSLDKKTMNKIQGYGTLIHKSKINDFFWIAWNYAIGMEDEKLREKLLAYVAGFSCHHALDTVTHPYVFYYSGVYDTEDPETMIYNLYHKKFEVGLDVANYLRLYGLEATSFKLHRVFTADRDEEFLLNSLFAQLIKLLYNETMVHHAAIKALQGAENITRFFMDPRNRKRDFIWKIEEKIDKPYIVSRVFYPLSEEIDSELYLNTDHRQWFHPCTKEAQTTSYVDLFNLGIDTTVERLIKIDSLMDGNWIVKDIIESIYQGLSYETGLNEHRPEPLQYFDCIYE
jgi:hypothetical protein